LQLWYLPGLYFNNTTYQNIVEAGSLTAVAAFVTLAFNAPRTRACGPGRIRRLIYGKIAQCGIANEMMV